MRLDLLATMRASLRAAGNAEKTIIAKDIRVALHAISQTPRCDCIHESIDSMARDLLCGPGLERSQRTRVQALLSASESACFVCALATELSLQVAALMSEGALGQAWPADCLSGCVSRCLRLCIVAFVMRNVALAQDSLRDLEDARCIYMAGVMGPQFAGDWATRLVETHLSGMLDQVRNLAMQLVIYLGEPLP